VPYHSSKSASQNESNQPPSSPEKKAQVGIYPERQNKVYDGTRGARIEGQNETTDRASNKRGLSGCPEAAAIAINTNSTERAVLVVRNRIYRGDQWDKSLVKGRKMEAYGYNKGRGFAMAKK
jgi:hypothetical protein